MISLGHYFIRPEAPHAKATCKASVSYKACRKADARCKTSCEVGAGRKAGCKARVSG